MKLPMATLRELLEYHYSRRERVYDFVAQRNVSSYMRHLCDEISVDLIEGLRL